MLKILQNHDAKRVMINFLNETTGLKLKDLVFKNIEKFENIIEYDFFLINLIGLTKTGLKQEIFIKRIIKGKIKESLFCICDLTYEKYFNNKTYSKDVDNKPKKISILEEKEKTKHINKVLVNLFEDNLNQSKVNFEIYFIKIYKIIEQSKKNIRKGRMNCIEINPNDMLIVGVKNSN